MPRPRRNHLAGVPLHIIQRGNNKKACFFADRDYAVYLDKLREYSEKYNVAIHSYVLMTNHVHLLLTPYSSSSVSDFMQSLGRYYVRYVNDRYGRTGTLWDGRFKDSLIDSERYLLEVSRYIELNPMRANIVEDPADYPWSSYRQNALGKNIKLLTPHQLYLSLGNNAEERQASYSALFTAHISEYTLEKIRTATNRAWVLGNSKFKEKIEEELGHRVAPFPRGGSIKGVRGVGIKGVGVT